ncbi:MAG: 3-isopropylmalate dehydratase small subunit [Acidimicrobiia bacterium]
MEPVTAIAGTMAPLPRAQVDTDQIIPKEFLKRVDRTGFGDFLFYDWAHDAEGELDPEFVLNRAEYQGARVLVAGPDFGSGSSREHAPWALSDWGFQAVIAPSLGDIFRSNCSKIGLLAVELPERVVGSLLRIADEDPTALVEIDLEAQTVTAPGLSERFEIDPFSKHMMLNGLDEIDLTLQNEAAIAEHELSRPAFLPTV